MNLHLLNLLKTFTFKAPKMKYNVLRLYTEVSTMRNLFNVSQIFQRKRTVYILPHVTSYIRYTLYPEEYIIFLWFRSLNVTEHHTVAHVNRAATCVARIHCSMKVGEHNANTLASSFCAHSKNEIRQWEELVVGEIDSLQSGGNALLTSALFTSSRASHCVKMNGARQPDDRLSG